MRCVIAPSSLRTVEFSPTTRHRGWLPAPPQVGSTMFSVRSRRAAPHGRWPMGNVVTLFKREFASYFATPLALVFIIIFLVLTGAFTFILGGFFERGQADL